MRGIARSRSAAPSAATPAPHRPRLQRPDAEGTGSTAAATASSIERSTRSPWSRARWDPAARAYLERKLAEGKPPQKPPLPQAAPRERCLPRPHRRPRGSRLDRPAPRPGRRDPPPADEPEEVIAIAQPPRRQARMTRSASYTTLTDATPPGRSV